MKQTKMNPFHHNKPLHPTSTFVIDVDGVICGPNDSEERIASYHECLPISEAVSKVQTLFKLGHTIILHTSRNVNTFKNNKTKLEQCTRPILEAWLKMHDIPYHKLVMGKPWGSGGVYYVDDRSLTVNQFLDSSTKKDWECHLEINNRKENHSDGNV